MTAPAVPMLLPQSAQDGFNQLRQTYLDSFNTFDTFRDRLISIDLDYMREKDQTTENFRAKIANSRGDSSKFQNITIPIIYPQVESAVEYQSEVFCTGYPFFSFTGPPDQWDAVEQMNVIMEDNSNRGGWAQEFIKAFRDGFKYNIFAIEADWESCITPVLETDITASTAQGTPREVVWSGNTIKRLDLYNTFWDRRYQPCDICTRGEFAGYHQLMSRTEMKTFINSLPEKIIKNIVPALQSAAQAWGLTQNTPLGYSIPQIRQDSSTVQDMNSEPNWMAWVGAADADVEIKYKNSYIVTIIYARIIPADFGLRVSAPQTPQIWKLTYVNNQVLLGAKRMTNAHSYLPILMAQPLDDGLAYQTKSLAENVSDIQDVSSALINSVIAARRRAISDRTIYDPSRISEKHINNPNPSAKIPVRPAAYGKPISESVYPFPFRDDQSGIILGELQQVTQMADQITGQNRSRRGQFQKGNKTLHEYQDVQDNSTGRDRMCSIGIEASLMTPLKYILKTNILQYQGVGVIFSSALQKQKDIDPVKLRNAALAFNVSDGLLPSSKILNTDALQQGFQTMAQVPQIAAGYNMTPLFSYLMKTQNADLRAFEKSPQQLAFEGAMQQWQQAIQALSQSKTPIDPKNFPPQPTPQQYGWDPTQGPGPTPTAPGAIPDVSVTYQNRSTTSGNGSTPATSAPISRGA